MLPSGFKITELRSALSGKDTQKTVNQNNYMKNWYKRWDQSQLNVDKTQGGYGPLGVPTRPKCVPEEGPPDPFPLTSKAG